MEHPFLELYNSLTNKVERVGSSKAVTFYACGPTVYDYAHIGNFRAYVFEDLVRRTLKLFGYRVHQVMNLTDVEDKIIKKALSQGKTLEEVTTPYITAFFTDLKSLNIEPVEAYPKATDYIPEMIAMIESLIIKKLAYQGDDKSIYFSIDKFPAYGCLSGCTKEHRESTSNRLLFDEYTKDNAADFVLWKAHDPARDGSIAWESPFGPGRPGWHIECSAMALALLGKQKDGSFATIDLHAGGEDNKFPHHENEIAQAEPFTSTPFVRHWIHTKHLLVGGEKMSKSKGNFWTIRDLLDKGYTGSEIRWRLLQTHYGETLNFTLESLEAAKQASNRYVDGYFRLSTAVTPPQDSFLFLAYPALKEAYLNFVQSLRSDLNLSKAIAVLFGLLPLVHEYLRDLAQTKYQAEALLALFLQMDRVFAILPPVQGNNEIPLEVQELAVAREESRQRRDWKEADRLRQAIAERGYKIEDDKNSWKLIPELPCKKD